MEDAGAPPPRREPQIRGASLGTTTPQQGALKPHPRHARCKLEHLKAAVLCLCSEAAAQMYKQPFDGGLEPRSCRTAEAFRWPWSVGSRLRMAQIEGLLRNLQMLRQGL